MGDSSVHSARTSVSKASEDCRSPKPGGILPHVRSRESVLDCGCPLPLWNGALTNPTRTETFNAVPLGDLDVRSARTSVSKASEDCRCPKPRGIPPAARDVAKRFGLRLSSTALEWGVNKPNAHRYVQRRSAVKALRPSGSHVCLQSVRGLPQSKTSRNSPRRERHREVVRPGWHNQNLPQVGIGAPVGVGQITRSGCTQLFFINSF